MTAKPKTEPAAKGIGVKELAEHLGTEPRKLRIFLRRTERAAGKGARYSWPALKSAEVRKIEADWKAAHSNPEPDADGS